MPPSKRCGRKWKARLNEEETGYAVSVACLIAREGPCVCADGGTWFELKAGAVQDQSVGPRAVLPLLTGRMDLWVETCQHSPATHDHLLVEFVRRGTHDLPESSDHKRLSFSAWVS